MKLTARQKKIYQEQDRILNACKKIKRFPFVLSGGTALSRFYFHHRFSEDLDFFYEGLDFNFKEAETIITHLRKAGFICDLVGRTDQKGALKIIAYVVQGNCEIKVDFLEDPLSGMWSPANRKSDSKINFCVDALDQIYYRKIYSVLEQWHKDRKVRRLKDLVDLYALHINHRSLEKTVSLYRKEHVSMLEEELIMILCELNKKSLIQDFKGLSSIYELDTIFKTLRGAGQNILKDGLNR